MLKHSLGVPKKAAKQLEGLPVVADLEQLLKQAGVASAQDYGVQWKYNDVDFKLFVRYEGHKIVWRLWNSEAADGAPPWTCSDRDPRSVARQVASCCKGIVGIKVPRAAAAAPVVVPAQTAVAKPAQALGNDQFVADVAAQPSSFESAILKSMGTADGAVDVDPQVVQAMTAALTNATVHLARWFAAQMNAEQSDTMRHLLITDAGTITDFIPDTANNTHLEEKVLRWRASTVEWCLSARARAGRIDFFIVPVADAVSVGLADRELDVVGSIALAVWLGEPVWTIDGVPASPTDIRRMLLKGLNVLVETKAKTAEQITKELELRNMAQRIVSQQEEVQRRIARDLHDAVIADVTLLKRAILAEPPMHRDEAASALDAVIARLREICYELAPSDLKDWGLSTTLEALVEQVASRTGAQCMLNFLDEVPSLDSFVELHIFRIVQEALNNSAKYSGATQISVTAECKHGWLSFAVRDNGKGFDTSATKPRTKHGGMGRTSMQERVEMIRTVFPARLDVASQPGSGTTTTLFIKVRN